MHGIARAHQKASPGAPDSLSHVVIECRRGAPVYRDHASSPGPVVSIHRRLRQRHSTTLRVAVPDRLAGCATPVDGAAHRRLAGGMTDPTPDGWRRVDAYLAHTLIGRDPALEAAVAVQRQARLPAIEVAPVSAKLLYLLARIARARRVLEIGTLAGYSTIWLARAVPDDGRVVTIEAEPVNAGIARTHLERAGVAAKVDVLVGRAAEVLPTLLGDEPFDLVFIDADKESNTVYLDWAAQLGRSGTVVVVDNVVRSGRVVDPDEQGPQVLGVRAGLEMLAADPRFEATALQTLDAKGWDGVAIAVVV